MKSLRTTSLLLLFTLAIFVALDLGSYLPGGGAQTEWPTDFEKARLTASSTGKPMLIDFSAAWCQPCQRMRTTTLADPAVIAPLKNYVLVSVDIDSNPYLTSKYGIQSIPAFVVLDARNDRILKQYLIGSVPPEQFLAWLNSPSEDGGSGVSPPGK